MGDLTKSEKKIARVCIDKGMDTEFREGLERVANVINDWKAGKFKDNRDAYHKMFRTVDKKDREISHRYDGLTGSRYLSTVASLFIDKYITEEDIAGFSDTTRQSLMQWKKFSER